MKSIINILFVLLFTATQSGLAQIFPGTEHFRTSRNLPFREIKVNKIIRVSDYKKGNATDAEAIENALNALVKINGSAELIFEAKKYEVDFKGESSFFFSIANIADKVIDGNGAEIILKNPTKGFLQLKNAKHCIVKNLKVDYSPLPFVQGIITSVDITNKTAECLIENGFPTFEDDHIKNAPQNWAMLKDSLHPGRQKENVKAGFNASGVEEISKNLYRLSFNGDQIKSFSKGDVYVQIGRYNGATIVNMLNCEKISLINITVYSSPAGGFNANGSSEINILDCNILIKPGRFISTNADCLHHIGEKIGTWVEGCSFEGHSDDTFNFKWGKVAVLEQPSDKTLVTSKEISKNEMLWIYNPRDGVLIDTVFVTNCEKTGNRSYTLSLSKCIPTLVMNAKKQISDQIYVDSERNESFVIRNNIIRNHRRYGMLLQSGYGLVENNRFENSSNSAIVVENGVDWGEGLVAQHLLIRNNTFVNSGSDYTFLKENKAAIFIQTSKLENIASKTKWCGVIPAPWRGMSDIKIENNLFELEKGSAVSVISAERIVIRNNIFKTKDNYTTPYILKENATVTEQNNNHQLITN
ncbi:MAG: right-handed parallel beta-helix repeat-containing protein [Paludibacter sp.]|nr:right-handed parallel beta-helix repeat-containing protein [Paludibacter sp.]